MDRRPRWCGGGRCRRSRRGGLFLLLIHDLLRTAIHPVRRDAEEERRLRGRYEDPEPAREGDQGGERKERHPEGHPRGEVATCPEVDDRGDLGDVTQGSIALVFCTTRFQPIPSAANDLCPKKRAEIANWWVSVAILVGNLSF